MMNTRQRSPRVVNKVRQAVIISWLRLPNSFYPIGQKFTFGLFSVPAPLSYASEQRGFFIGGYSIPNLRIMPSSIRQ